MGLGENKFNYKPATRSGMRQCKLNSIGKGRFWQRLIFTGRLLQIKFRAGAVCKPAPMRATKGRGGEPILRAADQKLEVETFTIPCTTHFGASNLVSRFWKQHRQRNRPIDRGFQLAKPLSSAPTSCANFAAASHLWGSAAEPLFGWPTLAAGTEANRWVDRFRFRFRFSGLDLVMWPISENRSSCYRLLALKLRLLGRVGGAILSGAAFSFLSLGCPLYIPVSAPGGVDSKRRLESRRLWPWNQEPQANKVLVVCALGFYHQCADTSRKQTDRNSNTFYSSDGRVHLEIWGTHRLHPLAGWRPPKQERELLVRPVQFVCIRGLSQWRSDVALATPCLVPPSDWVCFLFQGRLDDEKAWWRNNSLARTRVHLTRNDYERV